MNQPIRRAKTYNEAVRRKIGAGRREWLASGHPRALEEKQRFMSVRMGNGHGLTEPQSFLAGLLGEGWTPEYPVSYYKIDLANAAMKIAIELDGQSHRSAQRQAADREKDQTLTSLGWTVLRFSNRDMLNWRDSGMQTDASISMTLAQHGILPTP